MESIFESEFKQETKLLSQKIKNDSENITEHSLYYEGVLKQLNENEIRTLTISKIQTVNEKTQRIRDFSARYHEYDVFSVAALSNGVVVAGYENGVVKFWDSESGDYFSDVQAHKTGVDYFVLLSNGQLVSYSNPHWPSSFLGCQSIPELVNGVLNIWNTSGDLVKTIDTGDLYINCIAGLPDEQVVVGSGRNLEIWDFLNGICLLTLKGHIGNIRELVVFSNGKVVSRSDDNTVKLWDPVSESCLRTTEKLNIFCMVSLFNNVVAFGASKTIDIWDIEKGICLKKLEGHDASVHCLDVFSNGLLVSGSQDETIKIWDPESEVCLKTFEGHEKWGEYVFALPNGRIVSKEKVFFRKSLGLWDASLDAPSSKEQYKIIKAVSENKSLTILDLSRVDLTTACHINYFNKFEVIDLLKTIVMTHPTLETIYLDFDTLTKPQLKDWLVYIFSNQNRQIKNLRIREIPVLMDGRIMVSLFNNRLSNELIPSYSKNLESTLGSLKKEVLVDLKIEGVSAFEKGHYSRALYCQTVAHTIDSNFEWKWRHQDINKPFLVCVNDYYAKTYFFYQDKRSVRNTLFLAGSNEQNKIHLEQLCDCLDAIFNLRFLQASSSANKNSFEELILPSVIGGEEINLIDNLLSGWLMLHQTVGDQLNLIKHLSDLYLKSWHQEGWITEAGYFASEKQERERFLGLLTDALSSLSRIIPTEDFMSDKHQEYILLLLGIDAGVAKPHQQSGIKIHFLLSEYDLMLKNFINQILEQVKLGFGKNIAAFEQFLFEIEAQAQVQFYKLRQEQLGRADTGKYLSQLSMIKKRSSATPVVLKMPSISVSTTTNFCSIYRLSDQAELSLGAFHEELVDLLQSRKIICGLANAKLLEIKEKGNWANIKQLGWAILKAAPVVGTAMKYAHQGCQFVGQYFDILLDEARWIEELTGYLGYIKKGAKSAQTGIKLLEYFHFFKKISEGLDAKMRKLVDGSDLDTEASFKQFATVFKADAGKDALEQFVYSLLDRYFRQVQLLTIKGAQQLATAIHHHLDYLFLLNFNRWKLAESGEQRRIDMLAIMRHWVSYVHFFKDEPVTLRADKEKQVSVQSLLQHCGIFFNLDEELCEVDVILDHDETAHLYLMSDSGQYGYRKAEPELVEEFRESLERFKSGDQLFLDLQVEFSGKKTKEKLEMLKELGHVLGIRFSPRLLMACQTAQSVGAAQEVIWEPKIQLLEKRMDSYEENLANRSPFMTRQLSDSRTSINTSPNIEIPVGCVSLEEFDDAVNGLNKKVGKLDEEIFKRDELLCAVLLSHSDPTLQAQGKELQKTLAQKRADFAKTKKSYGPPISQMSQQGSADFPESQSDNDKKKTENSTPSYCPERK